MTVTLDDLETDFDGALEQMFKEAKRELEAVPPERLSAFYLHGAANHLARMIELNAPAFLIEMAEKRMARHLKRRATERRQSAGMKST